MARLLAKEENLKGEVLLVIELAALLHDVMDWKYATDDDESAIREVLNKHPIMKDNEENVICIIKNVGFKEELSGAALSDLGSRQEDMLRGLAIVQDADRLDAIGAIGIARCFMYAGKCGNALYDPSVPPREDLDEAAYRRRDQPALNHFHEKLLKLKGMMKTAAGRRRAEARHRFLEAYLKEFESEKAETF